MSKDTIYREDVINLCEKWRSRTNEHHDKNGWYVADTLLKAIKELPSADNGVVGKLKTAIESEEICKSCPTAERISRENLLGAMALGFSYGTNADRPQGEWIGYEVPSECSVCGHHWDEYVFGQEIWHDGSVPNYCPHCGARMKGADDEISCK